MCGLGSGRLWPAERTLPPTSQAASPRAEDRTPRRSCGQGSGVARPTGSRDQARETAKEWFERYPKAAYLTQVESWRMTDDGLVEFTMRRLPTAD